MISDAEHLTNIEALTEACEDAIKRGQSTLRLELNPVAWLAIVDEIKNRRRMNYSALIADQHVNEMKELIDRLHNEIVYLVAYGPRKQISDAMIVGQPSLGDIVSKARHDKQVNGKP